MKKMKKKILLGLFILLITGSLFTPAMAMEFTFLFGTVNDNSQLVDDNGDIYEIGLNDLGEELIRYIDKKVKVTGTVLISDYEKVIMVMTYEVIGE